MKNIIKFQILAIGLHLNFPTATCIIYYIINVLSTYGHVINTLYSLQ